MWVGFGVVTAFSFEETAMPKCTLYYVCIIHWVHSGQLQILTTVKCQATTKRFVQHCTVLYRSPQLSLYVLYCGCYATMSRYASRDYPVPSSVTSQAQVDAYFRNRARLLGIFVWRWLYLHIVFDLIKTALIKCADLKVRANYVMPFLSVLR